MANTNIDGTISTLFHGMDGFVSSKSVVGDPIKVGDTIIIPLLDVNFGMAAVRSINRPAIMRPVVSEQSSVRLRFWLSQTVRQDLLILRIRMPSARSLIWHLRFVDRITGFFKKEKTEEEEQIEQAVEEASKPAEE